MHLIQYNFCSLKLTTIKKKSNTRYNFKGLEVESNPRVLK